MENKKSKIITIAFLLIMLSNFSVSAQTNAEMKEDANIRYQKSDLKLNKVYRQLMTASNKLEKKTLLQAQLNWLKFRDSHCNDEAAEFEGGSMQSLVYISCLETTTNNRTKQLTASLKRKIY
jgi:uncharacterized protein YecT (DUF1311 family)